MSHLNESDDNNQREDHGFEEVVEFSVGQQRNVKHDLPLNDGASTF